MEGVLPVITPHICVCIFYVIIVKVSKNENSPPSLRQLHCAANFRAPYVTVISLAQSHAPTRHRYLGEEKKRVGFGVTLCGQLLILLTEDMRGIHLEYLFWGFYFQFTILEKAERGSYICWLTPAHPGLGQAKAGSWELNLSLSRR